MTHGVTLTEAQIAEIEARAIERITYAPDCNQVIVLAAWQGASKDRDALIASHRVLMNVARAAAPPVKPASGKQRVSARGDHGGPLVSVQFNYEDGTEVLVGHEWFIKLLQALRAAGMGGEDE